MMLCFVIFFILINLLFGFGSDKVDNNGHIGGIIIGCLLGFCILEPLDINGKALNSKISFG